MATYEHDDVNSWKAAAVADACPCARRAARRDWTSPDTDTTPSGGWFYFFLGNQSGWRSQVLVGVVLALAVRGRSQERQLVLAVTAVLVAALQHQYPATEVQAALQGTQVNIIWSLVYNVGLVLCFFIQLLCVHFHNPNPKIDNKPSV